MGSRSLLSDEELVDFLIGGPFYFPVRLSRELALATGSPNFCGQAQYVNPREFHRQAHIETVAGMGLTTMFRLWWMAWDDNWVAESSVVPEELGDGSFVFVKLLADLQAEVNGDEPYWPDFYHAIDMSGEGAIELAGALLLDGVEQVEVVLAEVTRYHCDVAPGYSVVRNTSDETDS